MSTSTIDRVRFVGLSEDPGEWDRTVGSWPCRSVDIYFSAGYHRASAGDESAAAILYVFERAGERLMYPFLVRRIDAVGGERVPAGYHDIETVYGFTGPTATTTDAEFLGAAWQTFDDWCSSRQVIAEFARFNPFLRNERYSAAGTVTTAVREHVVLDLDVNEDALWRSYSSINRNMIRKAEDRRVCCEFGALSDHLDHFIDLYHGTMDRNYAGSSYYFTREQLAILAEQVPCFVTVAKLGDEVAAISLFLLHDKRIHYHLSGCSPAGRQAAANNLILHRTVLEAKRRGLEQFHFGGGRSGAPDDALLKFKGNFSRKRIPAVVGGRIHHAEAYRRLCGLRRSQISRVPDTYFLAYRYDS